MAIRDEDRMFTIRNEEGDEIQLYIRDPNLNDKRGARKIFNSTISDALLSGAPMKVRLPEILAKQNLWDDEKEQKYNELMEELEGCRKKLIKGGIKLDEARKLAIRMRELRGEMRLMLMPQASIISITAEAQAENERFNYLVSKCAVYYKNKNKPYFSGYEDYLNRADEFNSNVIASKFAEIYHGLQDNEQFYPENQFLKKYDFVDENYNLVNKDGHLVDVDGNLINEFGQKVAIDENGQEIVIDENFIFDEDIESEPFLDEDGKPIVEETAKEDEVEQEQAEKPDE